MDEQAQVVEVGRRRSRAEAEQLVAEYEAGGWSQVEFCRKQGLSLATLARYRKRHGEGNPAPGSRWLAVEVSASGAVAGGERASGLAVELPGGRRIEVGRGFDADTLKRLLAVVERG